MQYKVLWLSLPVVIHPAAVAASCWSTILLSLSAGHQDVGVRTLTEHRMLVWGHSLTEHRMLVWGHSLTEHRMLVWGHSLTEHRMLVWGHSLTEHRMLVWGHSLTEHRMLVWGHSLTEHRMESRKQPDKYRPTSNQALKCQMRFPRGNMGWSDSLGCVLHWWQMVIWLALSWLSRMWNVYCFNV